MTAWEMLVQGLVGIGVGILILFGMFIIWAWLSD